MRKLVRIVLLLVVLLVVAAGVALYYVDRLARTGIERGGEYALGVQTTVDDADVGLLGGTLKVEQLTVANPEGFTTPHLVRVRTVDLGVETGTLMEETIRVRRFELDDVDMHIEQKIGRSNVSTILEHIQDRAGKDEPAEPGARKVNVDRIDVRNVTAHVQVLPVGGEATTVDVEVPEIILEDVSSDDPQGLVVAELTRRILPAILKAVVEKARGRVPGMDFDALASELDETTAALGQGARDLIDQAGKNIGGVLKDVLKKPGGEEGDTKEGGGLLDGILKPKGDGEKKDGGTTLDDLFKKDDDK